MYNRIKKILKNIPSGDRCKSQLAKNILLYLLGIAHAYQNELWKKFITGMYRYFD